MKKQFKVILFSLITLIFLTMIGNFVVRALDNNDEGKISLNKTASKQDDTYGRSADVVLDVSASKFTKSTTIDVVLVLDRSTSMNGSQKMQDTKEAAKSLVEKLMKNNTDLENPIVKVGIVTYGTNVIDSRYNKQTTSTTLSSVKSEVTTLIDNIPNKVGTTQKDGEATNIDAGLERANKLLTGSTANQKAVILLSDGIPTVFNYNGTTYGNTQNDGEVCIEKDYWSGKCTKQMRPSEAAKLEADKLKENGITIYTVGFDVEKDSSAAKFLQEISTVKEVNGNTTYPNFYLAKDKNDLEQEFDNILVSITTVATNIVVTDTIPLGFKLNEEKLKEKYGNAVSVSKNEGKTVITWKFDELKVGTNPKLVYTVEADKDYYGAMYTNESATLTGTAVAGNPAYPDLKIKETFPKPVVAIPAVTEGDSYSVKLGETKTVTKKDGILSNDHIKNRLTDDNAIVTDEIEVSKTANSCGKLTVNNDGSLEYTPDSSCLLKEVEFDYVIKTKVTVNGKSTEVISNTSKIKFIVSKEDVSIVDSKVEKLNSNGNSTNSITEPFSYNIKYSTTLKDHIGDAAITIVDVLPYEIDESKSNLNGGVYDAATKTITWNEFIDKIDTYKNVDSGKINIVKRITVVYLNIPNSIDKIVNKVNATIKVDKKEITKETEQETKIEKGTIIVKYQTTTGESLQDDKDTTGLINTVERTVAPKEITKDGITYRLVQLLDNKEEKSFEEVDDSNVFYPAVYQEKETIVKYIYYKQTADITNDNIKKVGTEVITSSNDRVNYQINYNAQIDNYIGKITVKVVDRLPYEIDVNHSDLAGGIYDAATKTITWIEEIDVNTYKNTVYLVEIKKDINVLFKSLDNTKNTITNKVVGQIITEINKSEEKSAEHNTKININGKVITKYLDTVGNEIAPEKSQTGKVGSDYTTSKEDIDGYVFVRNEGETTGQYIEGELVVKYIYYKQSGDTTETKIIKTGTAEITKTTDPLEYKVQYQTTVKEYIGVAEVTIVDTLPYEIDESNLNLDGGTYDAATKTITWVEKIAIDTNKNPESGKINIVKNIKVVYQGISSTTREIENKVSATIKTITETDPIEDTSKTAVSVKGIVIAHYQDTEGKALEKDEVYTDLVGNAYQTEEKNISGYKLVEIKGKETGSYMDEQQEVTYIYYKSTGEIKENTLIKDGITKITSTSQLVPYNITQNIKIENYIGTAVLTIIDVLPESIDVTKSDLKGGIYNEDDKTITWIIQLDVNTYEDLNTGIINFTKEIKLVFKNLNPTMNELTNKVTSTLKIEDNVYEKDDEYTSEVDVKGKVIVRYIDLDGKQLLDDKTLTGKIGKSYETKEEIIDGYILVKVDGDISGKYKEEDGFVTYIYTKVSTGNIEVIPPKTGVENKNSILDIFVLIASLPIVIIRKFYS
mgnify:CR=1 FL=1